MLDRGDPILPTTTINAELAEHAETRTFPLALHTNRYHERHGRKRKHRETPQRSLMTRVEFGGLAPLIQVFDMPTRTAASPFNLQSASRRASPAHPRSFWEGWSAQCLRGEFVVRRCAHHRAGSGGARPSVNPWTGRARGPALSETATPLASRAQSRRGPAPDWERQESLSPHTANDALRGGLASQTKRAS